MANGPYEFISTFKTDPFEEQRIAADRQRRMAELLAQQSEQYGQYQTPSGPLGEVKYPVSQGLAQLVTALGGAFKRGRAEREERELREGETAARGEANRYVLDAISGTGQAPAADPTVSDTAIPGEIQTAPQGSVYDRMMGGMSRLSKEAQSYVSPFAQQLGLSEAMAAQERERAREDYRFKQETDAEFRGTPETFRQLSPNELPPGARFGQQNVVTGKIEYDYIPPSMFGGQGGNNRNSYQQADAMKLADGTVVQARFNPDTGAYEYQNEEGQFVSLPPDARPTTAGSGGSLTPKQFLDVRVEYIQEEQALNRMNDYMGTVGDMNVGYKNLADQVSSSIKTIFDTGEYTPEEISRQVAEGQLNGLLGLFRTDIVGPGVMTEPDARRIVAALGGNIGLLTNPQVVEPLLRQIYEDKRVRADLLRQEVERNAPTYGYLMPAPLAPSALVAPAPAQGGAPGASDIQSQADKILGLGGPQ
tara:strand:- start:546 stop:1976 length:1431 start_codon:yes stop_codon:yes gene_type:complete